MNEFTQEEILAIVDKYIEENYPISSNANDFVALKKRRSRNSHAVAIEIIIKMILPTKRDFPESLGINFIAEHLTEKGIGKICEVEHHLGLKREPPIPFHKLPKEKPQNQYWWKKDQYA